MNAPEPQTRSAVELTLAWRRGPGAAWCGFHTAVLPDAPASGILLVWSGEDRHVAHVAAGGIAKNLKWARQFKPLEALPGLLVTWAALPEDRQAGVRNYLLARLHPAYSDPPTAEAPVTVNLPWEIP